MSGNRFIVQDQGGLSRNSRAGDSMLSWANPVVIAADAVDTLTVAKIASGAIVYTGFTAGRNLTTDTAANILAAFPTMDIGDSIYLEISSTAAFAGTFVAGAGVTLKGRATVPASSHVHVYIIKTAAATLDWLVL